MSFLVKAKLQLTFILFIYTILPVIVLVLLLKKRKNVLKNISLFLLAYAIFSYLTLFKFQYKCHNYPKYTKKFKLLKRGTWIDLLEHPTNSDLVIKRCKPAFDCKIYLGAEKDASGGKFINQCFGKCGRGWSIFKNMGKINPKKQTCNGVQYIYWLSITIAIWESTLTREKLTSIPLIPQCSELNDKALIWSEEKCTSMLDYKNPPDQYYEDLKQFNDYLTKTNQYLFDAHYKNIMVRNNRAKLIDGEILSPFYFKIGCITYSLIRGYDPIYYKDFDRIVWMNEPTRLPLDAPFNKSYTDEQKNFIEKFYQY